jgi:hypothetical protein
MLEELLASIFQIYTEEGGNLSLEDYCRNWSVYTFVRGGKTEYQNRFDI